MRRGDAYKPDRKTALTFDTPWQCLRILLMCFGLRMSVPNGAILFSQINAYIVVKWRDYRVAIDFEQVSDSIGGFKLYLKVGFPIGNVILLLG